ncbi:MAG: glutamine synthetase [Bacteroidota bacterium]
MQQDAQKAVRPIKIGVTDVDGVLRAKYLSSNKIAGKQEPGIGFCNVIFGWDIHDRLYEGYAPDHGFADAELFIDTSTKRSIPWEDHIQFYLADFGAGDDFAAQLCPRGLLKRLIKKAESMDLESRFGPEYEWFLYRESPSSVAEKNYNDFTSLSPGMFGYSDLRTSQNSAYHHDLFEQLSAFDVELEGLHTETGPGVLEAAIEHRPALEAADRAILFKQGVKSISYRHGLMSSFMAKPSAELPGCGGHLHQSLWRDGKNIFYDAHGRYGLSKLGEHYLAGLLDMSSAIALFFAPNVNSYKRYVPGSWAPTRYNWGIDNRTVAYRVIPGGSKGTRIEARLPGADANPYLAISACLAAGLYGIENELPLDVAPIQGSAYDGGLMNENTDRSATAPNPSDEKTSLIPSDLAQAIGLASADMRLPKLFGQAFVDHFLETRRQEWRQYQVAVTDWERRRYFELA